MQLSDGDRFSEVLGERRGAPPERQGRAPAPPHSPLERLRAFTSDLVSFGGDDQPDQLAAAHGFSVVEGRMAGSGESAPVYFLHDADADGRPAVRALVVSYPGSRPGTVRRGVLFIFDSESG